METLPRGMAFIDFPNITCGARDAGVVRLDFAELAKILTEGTRSVGVIAYVADRGNRQGLFRELDRSGLRPEPVSPGKSVDGRLIFDLLAGAQKNQYDRCILASGDRDYQRVLLEARSLNKAVWVASFKANLAPSLESSADKCIKLDDYLERIRLKRNMVKVKCADCGKDFELTFMPNQGRPVYCRECFPKHKGR